MMSLRIGFLCAAVGLTAACLASVPSPERMKGPSLITGTNHVVDGGRLCMYQPYVPPAADGSATKGN